MSKLQKPNHSTQCRCSSCRAYADAVATNKRGEGQARYVGHPDGLRVLRIASTGEVNEIDPDGHLVRPQAAPHSLKPGQFKVEEDGTIVAKFCGYGFRMKQDQPTAGPVDSVNVPCVWRAVIGAMTKAGA